LKQSQQVLALFQRACSDLSRIGSANSEPELRTYLETLVGRGYAEIHSSYRRAHRFAPLHWFMRTLPRTFRRQGWAFATSCIVTLVGMIVGGVLLMVSPYGKEVTMSAFPYWAQQTPSQRVAREEKMTKAKKEQLQSFEKHKSTFAGQLMQHNTQVAIGTLAMGLTYGIGTLVMLFYNGVILGAITLDYIQDGQAVFLFGWLLPHGAFEIPAILIAGQAGFVLARALIGWGTRDGLRARLRMVTPDLATLIGGAALMLVWAGFVESFLSQYHEPVVPYWLKIGFGVTELAVLTGFYGWFGRKPEEVTS
jgi:uncharacterized membrane protein SpoIIM required for sporulation